MHKIELNAKISAEEQKSLEKYVKTVLGIRKKSKPMANGIAIEITKYEEFASLLNQRARIGTFGDVEVLGVTPHNDGKKIAAQIVGSDYVWGIFFNIKETSIRTGKRAIPVAEKFLSDFGLRDGVIEEGPKINGVKRCYVNVWPSVQTGMPIDRGDTFYVFGKDTQTGEKYVAAYDKKSTTFIYYSEDLRTVKNARNLGSNEDYKILRSFIDKVLGLGHKDQRVTSDGITLEVTGFEKRYYNIDDIKPRQTYGDLTVWQVSRWHMPARKHRVQKDFVVIIGENRYTITLEGYHDETSRHLGGRDALPLIKEFFKKFGIRSPIYTSHVSNLRGMVMIEKFPRVKVGDVFNGNVIKDHNIVYEFYEFADVSGKIKFPAVFIQTPKTSTTIGLITPQLRDHVELLDGAGNLNESYPFARDYENFYNIGKPRDSFFFK